MAHPELILPRADAGCGKVFHEERRFADEHRIALEFWKRATGHIREGYHLVVYRCKRCGGFHIGQKRIGRPCAPANHTSLNLGNHDQLDPNRLEYRKPQAGPVGPGV